MEEPCLGMETRAFGVVRHSDFSPKLSQPIQGRRFRRSGVRGSENPQATTVLHMPPELLPERADTRPSDERHDHVNPTCRCDFRCDLVPHTRLARRIRQERGVEKWDQRFVYGCGSTIRMESMDTT